VTNNYSLADLGWQPFFQQQLSLHEWESYQPARVLEHHKATIEVGFEHGKAVIPINSSTPSLTVGDWLLLDTERRIARRLERQSLFSRKAPGSKLDEQSIAANIDTAFIVCSLNDDFNLNRIERFLTLVNQAGAEPVVVLSKADLIENHIELMNTIRALDPLLAVEAVNCLSSDSVANLRDWCSSGNTIALLGSSGSGKSTLSNTLLGQELQETGAIREDDSKGRHTTTRRSLLAMEGGAMLLDTPGMRELQLAASEEGIATTFADIEALAAQCRFVDCHHDNDLGCAVQAAVESGELDARRLTNYQKLLREQALNSAALSERRASDKKLGQFHKRTLKESHKLKRG
jgi:ribosome biogenesis GTPase